MFEKLLKHKLIDNEITITELAERLGDTQPNLSQKLKRDNFPEKEMLKIAEALNCELKIELVDK